MEDVWRWGLDDAWVDITCDIGSFESEAGVWKEDEVKLTKNEWYAVRDDLNARLQKLSEEVLDKVINLYLKGHYSQEIGRAHV